MRAAGGFTLRDMLIAVGAIGVLMFLALPAIEAAREKSRRHACVVNMKQLVIAIHVYHDKFDRFPHVTSTQIRGVAPASLPSDTQPGAGYHWQIAILPYIDQQRLYAELESRSKHFSLSPFDSAMSPEAGVTVSKASTFASNEFDLFRCPSQRGGRVATAPEYQMLGPNAVSHSSYVALSATHLDCLLGDPDSEGYVPPNGVMIPGPTVTTFRSVVDGTSTTLLLAETRERNYSSWYDGTVGWVVAADPNGRSPVEDENGLLTARSGTDTALNVGPSSEGRSHPYLPAALYPPLAIDWEWGPSSEHAGGAVVHAMADGAVRTITDEMDQTLYIRLMTRAGREPMNCCEDE